MELHVFTGPIKLLCEVGQYSFYLYVKYKNLRTELCAQEWIASHEPVVLATV